MLVFEKTISFRRIRTITGELSEDFKVRYGEVDHSFELVEPIEFNSFRPFNPLMPKTGKLFDTTEHVINIDEVTQIFIDVDGNGKVVAARKQATRDVNYFEVPVGHDFLKYVKISVPLVHLLGGPIPEHHGGLQFHEDNGDD